MTWPVLWSILYAANVFREETIRLPSVSRWIELTWK